MPAPERSGPLPWMALGASGLTALSACAWILTRTRRRPMPSAWQRAASAIDSLAAFDWTADHAGRRYHAALSLVVRCYLEDRFGVPADRLTTFEIARAVENGPPALRPEAQALAQILGQCDFAKFAGMDFPAAECRALERDVRGFLERTSPAPATAGLPVSRQAGRPA